MKTKFLGLIAVVAFVFTFSSCKKCYTCQFDGSASTEEICKPDNMNQKGWREYVDNYEEWYDATCK